MKLDLVHCGEDSRVVAHLEEVRSRVVAHADGADRAGCEGVLQGAPRLRPRGSIRGGIRRRPRHPRPVNERQVQRGRASFPGGTIPASQALVHPVEGGVDARLAHLVRSQLARDEHVVVVRFVPTASIHVRSRFAPPDVDSQPDLLLVAVARRGVDVAASASQGVERRPRRVLAADLERAEAEPGHPNPRGDLHRITGRHPPLPRRTKNAPVATASGGAEVSHGTPPWRR
mmetsp:Transcript_359/g.1447  ORF Transcript_359/g.1447 Transcript_359/m.1447 type:complete len:230 (+) Transcript_359:1269-1958(+)